MECAHPGSTHVRTHDRPKKNPHAPSTKNQLHPLTPHPSPHPPAHTPPPPLTPFLLTPPRPPRAPLSPSTTLSRSRPAKNSPPPHPPPPPPPPPHTPAPENP